MHSLIGATLNQAMLPVRVSLFRGWATAVPSPTQGFAHGCEWTSEHLNGGACHVAASSRPMTKAAIRAAATAIGLTLDDEQAEKLLRLRHLLLEANARFNLTAITADEDILALHFMDSLTPLPFIRSAQGAPGARLTLIDVGSGAGFPGIPLKIAMPELEVTLMDGTAKKVRFCQQAIAALALADIRAIHARAEEASHQRAHRERYDVVIARAVAPMPTLAEYLLPLARVGGLCIAMKGSEAQREAAEAAGAIAKLGGAPPQVHPVHLPDRADQRALILVHKVAPTPKLYPRAGGAPRKAALG